MRIWIVLAALLACFSLVSLHAQENTEDVDLTAFADDSFNKHVDILSVGAAISDGNASLLTDLALQLAEGERILMRVHKSGVTSEKLFEVCLRLATQKKDKETLARLAKIAKAKENKDLAAQVSMAQKLVGESRAIPELNVSAEEITPDQYAAFHKAIADINVAKASCEPEVLDMWTEYIGLLHPKHQEYLKKVIQEAKVEMPKPDPSISKLMGTTRAVKCKCRSCGCRRYTPKHPIWKPDVCKCGHGWHQHVF